MTPDWSASPTPVPYASFSDPQSLDLYAYTLDNPETNTDPNGHWCFIGIGTTCAPKKVKGGPKLAGPDWFTRCWGNPLCAKAILAGLVAAAITENQLRRQVGSLRRHPYISGALFGLSLFVGPEAEDAGMAVEAADSAANAGTITQIGDATSPGSVYNLGVDLTPEEFGDNLEQGGYSRADLGKGVVQYTKGDGAYTVYPDAASTGEPAVQVKVAGRVVSKLRLRP